MKQEILITGGTGSLGKALIKYLNKNKADEIKGIRVYSRDELKQLQMRQTIKSKIPIAYLIGDIRDYRRLEEALSGVHICIHAAALKQVPTAEENPLEYIQTNVDGTANVFRACIKTGVLKATLVSTDKAVAPINLYGATKMVAEKLWLRGHVYTANRGTEFNIVRYGNVIGSRGSIADIIKGKDRIDVTDPSMTRFWIPLPKVAQFVYKVAIHGNDAIYIPKMKSCSLATFFEALGIPPDKWNIVGKRPGEKIHECLINSEEIDYTEQNDKTYIINFNHRSDSLAKLYSGPLVRIYSDYRNPLYTDNPEEIKELL